MTFQARASADDVHVAGVVRDSRAFDAQAYLAHVDDPEARDDPALHYVMLGERQGAPASAGFSGATYVALNPDLAGAPVNLLWHYEAHGRAEGRSCTFESEHVGLDYFKLDPGKPVVLLLLHEATYSGAPILGWNLTRELKLTRNVVVVTLRGGPLLPALQQAATAVVGPLAPVVATNPAELKRLAERLTGFYKPTYAIANSVETRLLATALREEGTPFVALVHEFATHAPPHALKRFYERCAAIVFPSELVRRSSREAYGLIEQRSTYILPQGRSEIPRLPSALRPAEAPAPTDDAQRGASLEALLAVKDAPFTVIGLGAVDLRKGVDLFIAAATAAKARHPDIPLRFIWVGERVHAPHHQYNVFVDEQVSRSGLEWSLFLFPHVDDLEPLYAAADALFISSRLDPLPNVGIDAAVKGIPLLCFDAATGFAELLRGDPVTAPLVAPHLDAAAIGEQLVALAADPLRHAEVRTAMQRLARRMFDMERYAGRIDALGCEAARRLAGIVGEAPTLMPDDAFDSSLYFGPEQTAPAARASAVATYLDQVREVDFAGAAVWGHHPRRALPGFHPLMYARQAPDALEAVDPLVDFIRKGRPAGPWAHEVIRWDGASPVLPSPSGLRVAIHGHFHYVDNIADFLDAVAANATPMDLVLTTTGEAAAEALRAATRDYKAGRVSIVVGRNLGRDIRPFVDLLGGELDGYDVVGHLHGKRSVHTLHYDAELGNRWRHFLWQHLLGPAAPVADIVLDRFENDETLGLVFPENDFLVGWEQNLDIARTLAPRMGLATLPEHIEFPVGTMFWARPRALRALVDANFSAADYPVEPLPIDGTMLHALERMIPLVVEEAGFRYATTFSPSFLR